VGFVPLSQSQHGRDGRAPFFCRAKSYFKETSESDLHLRLTLQFKKFFLIGSFWLIRRSHPNPEFAFVDPPDPPWLEMAKPDQTQF
jgi:hypothetical protein